MSQADLPLVFVPMLQGIQQRVYLFKLTTAEINYVIIRNIIIFMKQLLFKSISFCAYAKMFLFSGWFVH